MSDTFRSSSLFRLAFVVSVLIICSSRMARAIDEAESFALLVETLNGVDDPSVHGSMLRGMLSGLEGRRDIIAPHGWRELSEKLAASEDADVRGLSRQLSQIFGDDAAISYARALVVDKSATASRRRTALRSLLVQQDKDVSSLLVSLLDEPELALDAIRGYARVEFTAAPAILLGRYKQLGPEHRRAVIETLASRRPYAEALLVGLKQGDVSRDDLPAHVARALSQLLGDRFVQEFGEIRPISTDREKRLAQYKRNLTPLVLATANASHGRTVFNKTCAACHQLYGEGGKVGPDLTGSNRANLDYILLNSVDPSYDVPDAYKTVTIVTDDGRVINGVLAEEDATRVVLKTPEEPRVVIAKEDIDVRKVSPKSMMPDGQLEQLKKQEVIDLIKYLRTTEQVELAK